MLLLLILSNLSMDIASTLNTIHDFSYPSLFHGGMAAKDLSPGVNIGVWDTRRTYFQSPWRNFGMVSAKCTLV